MGLNCFKNKFFVLICSCLFMIGCNQSKKISDSEKNLEKNQESIMDTEENKDSEEMAYENDVDEENLITALEDDDLQVDEDLEDGSSY